VVRPITACRNAPIRPNIDAFAPACKMLTCWLDDTATPSPSTAAPSGTTDRPSAPADSSPSAITAKPAICIAKPDVTAALLDTFAEYRAHTVGAAIAPTAKQTSRMPNQLSLP
jgi:hypothetical protein